MVEVLHGDNKYYFSCTQPTSLADSELGLNATYARNLGIRENDSVTVRGISSFPSIKFLTICTKNQDDYDIMVI